MKLLRTPTRTLARVTLGLSALALVAAGCGTAPSGGAGGGGIGVGVITDMSGPTVANQLPWLHGFQAAVGTVNDDGGIDGQKINVKVEDDKFDGAQGLAAYKRLVNQDKVIALSGFGATDTQAAVEPYLEKDGVSIIGGQTVSLNLSVPQHDHFFAVAPAYKLQADVIAGIIQKKTGKAKPKVAEIDSGITSGVQFKGFINSQDSLDVVGNFVLPASTTSADAVIQKVIANKPDYIAFHGSASSGNAVLKSMQKFNAKIPLLAVAAAASPATWEGVDPAYGKLFEFVQGVTPAPTKVEGTAEMVAAAKAEGHADEASDPAFVTGYISGTVLVDGLKKAGKDVTKESLTKALGSLSDISTGGLTGPMGYGSKDRVGMTVLRPYTWDYATKSFKPPIGEYDDYASLAGN